MLSFVCTPTLALHGRKRLVCAQGSRGLFQASSIRACTPPPSSETVPSSVPIPSSFNAAVEQALLSIQSLLSTSQNLVFLELDTTSNDETYTLLKSTLPLLALLPALFPPPTKVYLLLPDAGAAALFKRDQPTLPENVSVGGLEQAEIDGEGDIALIIACPRATDTKRLVDVVESAEGKPIVVVNADLVDMGVTGLSLNARRLRERLVDRFEWGYCLKTFDWGLVMRAWPEGWGVWLDKGDDWVKIKEVEQRPGGERLEEILEEASAEEGNVAKVGIMDKIARWVSVYMKG